MSHIWVMGKVGVGLGGGRGKGRDRRKVRVLAGGAAEDRCSRCALCG